MAKPCKKGAAYRTAQSERTEKEYGCFRLFKNTKIFK